VHAAEIGVSVDSGVVRLSGTVRSYPEKWAAENAAERVKGVKAISDEIEVRLPGTSERKDADVARAAANALEWNVFVPKDRIKALVENGWVVLDGAVEFQFQKVEAENAVRALLGVKGVVNHVALQPLVSPSDVKGKIVKALERAAEVEAKRISVNTEGGQVTLRGNVTSWAERQEAERAAWAAPGVTEVQNRLVVA